MTTSLQLHAVIISTLEEDIINSSAESDKEALSPCNHEEADSRIFVHAKHASLNGLNKIMIRTVDTDVVVLAIANARATTG